LNPIGERGASQRKTKSSRKMKPMPLTKDRRRDSFDRAAGKNGRSPITDYSYQPAAFGGSSGGFARNPAFWNIAGDYFKDEARYDFWGEAMLFAFITVTAALPLMNNLHALLEFVRAITSQ
jgi:hypothetical protein